jgi:hypothetical protein
MSRVSFCARGGVWHKVLNIGLGPKATPCATLGTRRPTGQPYLDGMPARRICTELRQLNACNALLLKYVDTLKSSAPEGRRAQMMFPNFRAASIAGRYLAA